MNKNIEEISSQSLQELSNYKPGRIVRYGVVYIFIILVALITLTCFIPYPRTITAYGYVHALSAPRSVAAKVSGRLTRLCRDEGGKVVKGEAIAFIESLAEPTQILQLQDFVDSLQSILKSGHFEILPEYWRNNGNAFSNLGELQAAFESFSDQYFNFTNYLNGGLYEAKRDLLLAEHDNTKQLYKNLYRQYKLQVQDLSLAQEIFDLHDTLYSEALITKSDYRAQLSQLIVKKMTLPQIEANIIGNTSHQNTIEKDLLELSSEIFQKKMQFSQQTNTFRNLIEEWINTYIVTAPNGGELIFRRILEQGQIVKAGETLCFVADANNIYFIELTINQNSSSRIGVGMNVYIDFSKFPKNEYGIVTGKIDLIRKIPTDSGYSVKVRIDSTYNSLTKRRIFLEESLNVRAEILTEKYTIARRVLGKYFK